MRRVVVLITVGAIAPWVGRHAVADTHFGEAPPDAAARDAETPTDTLPSPSPSPSPSLAPSLAMLPPPAAATRATRRQFDAYCQQAWGPRRRHAAPVDHGYGRIGGGPFPRTYRDALRTPIFLPAGQAGGRGLDPRVIRRVVLQHSSQLEQCRQAQPSASNSDGLAVMRWLVSPNGHVVAVQEEPHPPALSGCLANVMRRLRLPDGRDGALRSVEVTVGVCRDPNP